MASQEFLQALLGLGKGVGTSLLKGEEERITRAQFEREQATLKQMAEEEDLDPYKLTAEGGMEYRSAEAMAKGGLLDLPESTADLLNKIAPQLGIKPGTKLTKGMLTNLVNYVQRQERLQQAKDRANLALQKYGTAIYNQAYDDVVGKKYYGREPKEETNPEKALSFWQDVNDEIDRRIKGRPDIKKTTLPAGVTEADIQFTMKKYKVTRAEVLKRIRAK